MVSLNLTYLEGTYYSCSYNRLMRKTIHEYKYEGKSYLYQGLGEIMVYTMEEVGLIDKIDGIVFVPMEEGREARRGYNQSKLLAKYIATSLNIPFFSKHLIKVRKTEEQNKLKRRERLVNLKDSFKVINKKDIKNKDILIIDDIITTGATMEECAKTLVEAGANKVYGLALTSSGRIVG